MPSSRGFESMRVYFFWFAGSCGFRSIWMSLVHSLTSHPIGILCLHGMCLSSSCSAKPMMQDVSLTRMISSIRRVRCVESLLRTPGSQLSVVLVVSTPLMCSGMRSYYLNSASALAHSIATTEPNTRRRVRFELVVKSRKYRISPVQDFTMHCS